MKRQDPLSRSSFNSTTHATKDCFSLPQNQNKQGGKGNKRFRSRGNQNNSDNDNSNRDDNNINSNNNSNQFGNRGGERHNSNQGNKFRRLNERNQNQRGGRANNQRRRETANLTISDDTDIFEFAYMVRTEPPDDQDDKNGVKIATDNCSTIHCFNHLGLFIDGREGLTFRAKSVGGVGGGIVRAQWIGETIFGLASYSPDFEDNLLSHKQMVREGLELDYLKVPIDEFVYGDIHGNKHHFSSKNGTNGLYYAIVNTASEGNSLPQHRGFQR